MLHSADKVAFHGADEISVASLDCGETKMESLKDSQSQTNLSQLHSKACHRLKKQNKSATDLAQSNNRKIKLEQIDQSFYESMKLKNNMSDDTIIDSS